MSGLLKANTKLNNSHKELFLKVQSGEASKQELDNYCQLKKENDVMGSELESMEAIWQKLTEYPIELDSSFDLDTGATPNKNNRTWLKFAIAATLACVSILVLLNLHNQPSIQYQTAYSQLSQQKLIDDSSVHLNASSEIEVSINDQQRRVLLKQGEALFTVAKDPDRKFIVQTPLGAVQAIGTQFNVNLLSDSLVVTVIEGTVLVSTPSNEKNEPNKAEIATANQQVKLNRQRDIHIEDINDTSPLTAWRHGKLVFNGLALNQALEMAERHTKHKITILDTRLNELPIYGVFNSGDIKGFLDALEHSFPLVAIDNNSNGSYLVYRRQSPPTN